MSALKVGTNTRAELPKHESQKRRGSVHHAQGGEHQALHASNTPDAQMGFAPLGIRTRREVVAVDAASEEQLDDHHPEQGRKRRGEREQGEERADDKTVQST